MYNVGLLMYKTYHRPLLYTINFNYIVLLTVATFPTVQFQWDYCNTHCVFCARCYGSQAWHFLYVKVEKCLSNLHLKFSVLKATFGRSSALFGVNGQLFGFGW